MTAELVVEPDTGVARIWIDRADSLNALDEPTRAALLRAIRGAVDDPAVRVLVLRGRGRAFCVGQDLAASHELVDAGATVRETYNPLVAALTSTTKPVVAAVNGPAVGAGMGLALACDVVVMAPSAFYSCAFSQVALVPDTGSSVALVRAVGYHRAYEIATTARRVPAEEALALGLVTEVAGPNDFDDVVARHVAALAASPVRSNGLTKQLLRSIDAATLATTMTDEADYQRISADDDDHAEGVRAFRERRPARFGGRPAHSVSTVTETR